MVRKSSVGTISRTRRNLVVRSVMRPTPSSGREGVGASGRAVVVPEALLELLARLLGQEALELGPEFLTAWQVLVTGQQRTVLLGGNECIVLSLQRRHHLGDLGTGLDLLVDLGADLGRRIGQCGHR